MSTAIATPSPASNPAPAGSSTDAQRAFWQESLTTHSSSLLQTMLLHDDEAEADAMNKGEIEEVFAMCRIQKDWTVCEWAAGMGRLTPLLAAQSRFVYSSDFVQAFCDANVARLAELSVRNVQVDCIDASEYDPSSASAASEKRRPPFQTDCFDMVFINWLLLYLDDEHAEKFIKAVVTSLKKQITSPQPPPPSQQQPTDVAVAPVSSGSSSSGLLFLHESCWERSLESAWFASQPASERARLLALPNEKTEDCQTYYRTTFWYEALFERCGLQLVQKRELSVYKNFDLTQEEAQANADKEAALLKASTSGPIEIEDDHYNKQICWLLRIKQD